MNGFGSRTSGVGRLRVAALASWVRFSNQRVRFSNQRCWAAVDVAANAATDVAATAVDVFAAAVALRKAAFAAHVVAVVAAEYVAGSVKVSFTKTNVCKNL